MEVGVEFLEDLGGGATDETLCQGRLGLGPPPREAGSSLCYCEAPPSLLLRVAPKPLQRKTQSTLQERLQKRSE